jgi:uncharacterized protein YcbX
MTATVAAIYRYPVKGLTPEPLDEVRLEVGQTLPFDRAYAIEAGGRLFDPAHPKHLAKTHFLMLMRDTRLALLDCRFDPETTTLTIRRGGAVVAEGRLSERVGRMVIEQFMAGFMGTEMRGIPKVVTSPGHSFSDRDAKVVSVINLASVREIARVAGRPVDPLRFRGNLYVEGWPAWAEFDLVGKSFAIGAVTLCGIDRIRRCAATNVDPQTAARDMQIPRLLQEAFGHGDCGIYATVTGAGTLTIGDAVHEIAEITK